MTIGTRIKKVLKFKKLDQVDLSRHTGISQSKMSRIVNNLAKPNINDLEQIANCLEITLFELLGYCKTFDELLNYDTRKVATDTTLER